MSRAGAGSLSGPVPQGAGRNWSFVFDTNGPNPMNNTRSREGGVYDATGPSSTNAGNFIALNTAGANTWQLRNGSNWSTWAGVQLFAPRVRLLTTRPSKQFAWFNGKYVWEAVLMWTVAPSAGVDSGLFWMESFPPNTYWSAGIHGIGVANRAGVLSFVSRGPGGNEIVSLAGFAGPLDLGNKVAVALCHATAARPARVDVWVNDNFALRREWTGAHKLPAYTTRGDTFMQTSHGEGGNGSTYLWVSQLNFGKGRDVEGL